jgi:hypothetical protein
MYGAILNDVDLKAPRYGDSYLAYQGYGQYTEDSKDGVVQS